MRICMVNMPHYSKGSRSLLDNTIASHFYRILLYRFLALIAERDQYQVGFVVSSGCLCNNTQSMWTLNALVSGVMSSLNKLAQ